MGSLINSYRFTPVATQFINQTTENSDWIINSSGGHGTRYGLKIISGSVGIGKFFQFVKLTLSKFTNPSGNYQITLRDSSDTVKFTKNFNISALSTSKAVVEHDLSELVGIIAEGDRILFEYNLGGDTSSGAKIYYNSSSGVSGFNATLFNYSSVYVDYNDQCPYAIIDSQA